MSQTTCTHTDRIHEETQMGDITSCVDCVKIGDEWISLRMCLICGHVGCCDSSKNKHATKHFEETNHPIMKSVTPGEEFTWCYIDKTYLFDALP